MINPRNTWQGEGNLVRDAEIATTKTGAEILEFTIAVNGAGNTASDPAYITVKMWLVENEYAVPAIVRSIAASAKNGELTKGLRIKVIGSLRIESWENEKGKGNKVVIMAENLDYYVDKNSKSNPVAASTSASASSSASEDIDPRAISF